MSKGISVSISVSMILGLQARGFRGEDLARGETWGAEGTDFFSPSVGGFSEQEFSQLDLCVLSASVTCSRWSGDGQAPEQNTEGDL